MNILLVDDDIYTIEALRQSLDWEALGIENAYYAYGTSQAKKIMEDVPIHILVSDIEMPKENGFALLEWIREKGFLVQEILLTMYAEFQYAQQAIQYDCFAYVLKPINYEELAEMIRGAIQKEKEMLRHQENAHVSDMWESSERMRKEHFFRNLRTETARPQEYGLDYSQEELFLPVLVQNYETGRRIRSSSSQGMEDWEKKNLLRKLFQKAEVSMETVLKTERGYFMVYLRGGKTAAVETALNQYFTQLKQEKGQSASAFVGIPGTLQEFRETLSSFECYVYNHPLEASEICRLETYQWEEVKYAPADFGKWERLLSDDQLGILKEELNWYLDSQQKSANLTYQNLWRFIGDFQHMVYSVLKTKGILAYEMTEAVFSEDLIERASCNVTEAKHSLMVIARTTSELMTGDQKEVSIEDKILTYIDENIDQELTRENLAEMVFLNPDYLARIFKKKTGSSIGNYIQDRRIDLARQYLEKSDEPVNMVAIKCGYDNFSYFTKVFKGKTNLTPKEYRKQFQTSEKEEKA